MVFIKNKARNIKLCANQILEKFNGEVPHTMEELISLSELEEKSANVILLEVFELQKESLLILMQKEFLI